MNGNDDFSNAGTTASSGPGSTSAGDPAYQAVPYAAQPGSGYTDPYAGQPQPGTGQPYTAGGVPPYGAAYPPVPPPPGTPNPGLATLLGFIPGVGAMYNGQFAKGLAHIVIFGVLTSLADHGGSFFGILVSGWYIYMVFDSYQTARAHRDGLVPPDPFGLNNIGAKFGMEHGPNWNDFVARPAAAPVDPAAAGVPPSGQPAGAPSYGYSTSYADPNFRYSSGPGGTTFQDANVRYSAGAGGTAYPEYASTYAPGSYDPASAYPGAAYAGAAAPYATNPYAAPAALDPAAPTRTGLPMGAIVLIGLGVLALLSTLGHNYYWSGHFFGGGLLILLGVALIARRAMESRRVYPDNTAAAQWYALHGSRAGLILALIGVFVLIHMSDWVHHHHEVWAYLLIVLGLYQIGQRAAYNRMVAAGPSTPSDPGYTPYPQGSAASATAAGSASGMPSVVPQAQPRDEEGR